MVNWWDPVVVVVIGWLTALVSGLQWRSLVQHRPLDEETNSNKTVQGSTNLETPLLNVNQRNVDSSSKVKLAVEVLMLLLDVFLVAFAFLNAVAGEKVFSYGELFKNALEDPLIQSASAKGIGGVLGAFVVAFLALFAYNLFFPYIQMWAFHLKYRRGGTALQAALRNVPFIIINRVGSFGSALLVRHFLVFVLLPLVIAYGHGTLSNSGDSLWTTRFAAIFTGMILLYLMLATYTVQGFQVTWRSKYLRKKRKVKGVTHKVEAAVLHVLFMLAYLIAVVVGVPFDPAKPNEVIEEWKNRKKKGKKENMEEQGGKRERIRWGERISSWFGGERVEPSVAAFVDYSGTYTCSFLIGIPRIGPWAYLLGSAFSKAGVWLAPYWSGSTPREPLSWLTRMQIKASAHTHGNKVDVWDAPPWKRLCILILLPALSFLVFAFPQGLHLTQVLG